MFWNTIEQRKKKQIGIKKQIAFTTHQLPTFSPLNTKIKNKIHILNGKNTQTIYNTKKNILGNLTKKKQLFT